MASLCAVLRHCLLVLLLGLTPGVHAITAEEATRVGGDMTMIGNGLSNMNERMAEFKASVGKIVDAAPTLFDELEKSRVVAANGRGQRELATNSLLGFASMAALIAASLVFRRATMRWRRKCLESSVRARGAAGLFALDALQLAVVALGAFLAVKFYFDTQDLQALMLLAILSGVVRWMGLMLFLETALRPSLPAFRLIAMSDVAAHRVRWLIGSVTFVGILGIAIMPVLLRAGLPVPAGQLIVLCQGAVVALGVMLALLAYRASRPPSPARRTWSWLVGAGIPLVLLTWVGGVITLEFAAYHSLVYTLRIAMYWYVVHAVLDLSSGAFGWYRLVQHASNAGAALALTIVLSELWLVERLGVVKTATWLPIRHSLETTAITLFIGFVAWRYLDVWTEQRLRAASPGLAPGIDDDVAAEPASRLTTLLPLVRVLVGVVILIAVAFLGMSQLGVDVTTLLAGAGVFGLALSFGSQALVRDIVAGIFFMSDDAFRVGEYIDTGRLKGTVERVTLRSVRLRHQNGQIHTIPFGQLNAITNFSRDWQTVKFNLRLSRNADIEQARKTVKRVGQEMLQDAEFGKEFLLPLKLQGMAEITDSALVVRLKFTVRPSNPSVVQREALKRLHRAFAQDGIEFAAGVITVQPAGPHAMPVPALGAVVAAAAVEEPRPAQ